MKFKKQKQLKDLGFTLIELLVVISIIGLLASIITASLGTARAKARDVKRRADSKQIETALNLYYSDYGSWPNSSGWKCFGAPSSETCWTGSYTGLDSIVTAMQPYMSTFPTTGATPGNWAYNRFLYYSSVAANSIISGNPAGAYLMWYKENTMAASECQSVYPPQHYDAYWYCYEFVGSP